MTTTINSNGSRYAGQAPATVAELLLVLESHTLDPRFEDYGNFILLPNGPGVKFRFFGNFVDISHVFSIDTDDDAVIGALTQAIRKNQSTIAYKEARDRDREEQQRRAARASDIKRRLAKGTKP